MQEERGTPGTVRHKCREDERERATRSPSMCRVSDCPEDSELRGGVAQAADLHPV